ncbi:putative nuclear mrna splicing factor-associated protein [Botrytis fragariae]|uniref:Putative nuclear mrna splicing factor-associated protein n=1 Tax=Botrytis fragariae TaxID=1964551 RepID=A0A8H6ALR0_9HELO|nr:putative nuclear mrna splicing factor-associated protein [Botrytis fragariae]KAF5870068.1 putative nuclear mrna splicing factor-associated protein [Botrytis fragariae]
MEQRQNIEGATAPFPTNPEEFDSDDRISFSKLDQKYLLVQDDGTEFEFDDAIKRWIPVLDEALLEEQQKAYKVSGVDESEPVDAIKRKRKQEYVNGEDEGGRMVKAPKKTKKPLPPRANTAVYVTGLPSDVTVEEVHEVFSRKCGVIAEEIDSGKPRIKLYTDEKGEFKGDALIVFFKAPSVQMAIMLLDDTDFRMDGGTSKERIKMRVQAAEASYKKVQQTDADGNEKEKPKTSMKDKQKIIKKTQKLDARLADWSDDEPSALVETSSKWDKVVILKHMFTLKELEEDPAAMLDIKEDIRDECGKLGEVTNVVLYDLEKDGVASVRFANAESAKACVKLMNGRKFDGQEVEAYITDGKEHFKKSKKKADGEDHGESESD